MSLPVSLTTDCGGLLNHRGPGRKCCCHTEDLHAGYHVYFSHGWFLSRICELSNFSSHGASRRVTGFCHELSNYRISFHTENRGRSRDFVTNYRIIEFLFTRRVTEVFFVTRHVLCHEFARLVLGPTAQREVICELVFFTRNVTDGHGGYEGGTIEA